MDAWRVRVTRARAWRRVTGSAMRHVEGVGRVVDSQTNFVCSRLALAAFGGVHSLAPVLDLLEVLRAHAPHRNHWEG